MWRGKGGDVCALPGFFERFAEKYEAKEQPVIENNEDAHN